MTTTMTWRKHRSIGDWNAPTTECYPYTITTYPKKRYVLSLNPSETVMGEWDNIGDAKAFAQRHMKLSRNTVLHPEITWQHKELVEVEA